MTPLTPDELLSLARPMSESMYLGIKQMIDDLAAARAPKERPESEAAQAIEVVRGFLRRVTHWQEGKPDCHDAMEALDSADDDVDWIEHGIVEWREVALKAQADLAAARALLREFREATQFESHGQMYTLSGIPRELTRRVDAALALAGKDAT